MLNFLLLYLLSILLFMNFSSSFFLFWMMLEFNMILFISLMTSYGGSYKMTCMDQSFYYFMLQSLGSTIFLVSAIFFSNYFSLNIILLFISLIFKLGLFPLQFWVFKLGPYMCSMPFFLLLTMQKFPLMIFMFNFNNDILLPIVFFSFLFGSLFLILNKSMTDLLISSSIYSTMWFFLGYIMNIQFFFLFFFSYIVFISFLCLNKNLPLFYNKSMMEKILYLFIMSYLISLPPFSMFFFKFSILKHLIYNFSFNFLSLLWISSFFSLVGYFKVMINFLHTNLKLYSFYKGNFNSIFLPFVLMMLTFLY